MRNAQLWVNKTPKEQKMTIALLIDAMLHSDVATRVVEKTLQKFIDKGYIKSKFIGEITDDPLTNAKIVENPD